MISVGITGGIGTGKSTICRILGIMGYPVFYSDTAAKEILSSNSKVRNQIIELFGSQSYRGDKPDKEFLAQMVFNNTQNLEQLNQIVHPAVRKQFADWSQVQNSKFVFNEAAILFESGSYKNFSKTILVTSPTELRIERLLKRDQTSVEQIKARMANQWSDDQKIPLADFIVVNDEKVLIIPQVLEILKKLKS
ncbi:MAG: dephospho-CoA kinase [Crocinitomicaceae bacterium]|nr:dephospho-CoA kinase [Crocinitomicaceae bacterium]